MFPERETSRPGKMRWSRRAIPASSSKGTSTSGESSGTPHMDAKQPTPDGPVHDASMIHTNDTAVISTSKSGAIDISPETPADDQVEDVMTLPAKV